MAFLGGIGEIYAISTAIGSVYMAIGVLMGQFGGGSHGGSHGHATIGDHGVHGHATHGQADAAVATSDQPSSTSITHISPRMRGPSAALLSVLSPTTIAIFCTLFGMSGLVILKLAPFLGLLTMVPAAVMGTFLTSLMLRLFNWLLSKSDASSAMELDELIGQQAQINTPIKDGRTGEVICEFGSKRYNYPAKAMIPDQDFHSGAKVIISDIRDGVLYVETWTDFWVDTDNMEPTDRRTHL